MDMKIRLLIEHRRKTFKRYVLWYRKLQIPFYLLIRQEFVNSLYKY